MADEDSRLSELGFSPFFERQLTADERARSTVARVIEVQRSQITVSDGAGQWSVPITTAWQQRSAEQRPTVGDWVVLDPPHQTLARVLERKSVFRRLAAGEKSSIQLIAANVDTLFVVTSCNEDFNDSRLERYLSQAFEAQVTPVVVVTKADLVPNPEVFLDRARRVRTGLCIELVNALDDSTLSGVRSWIAPGQTIAFVGSSGVGKSTLINTLLARSATRTGAIREDDSKGRHTTSYRSLYRLPEGGLLIDVPGMRELRVAELDSALQDVFDDITRAAEDCRFKDCSHDTEPGCAVREAVENGEIDERRLRSFRKLQREDARNSATLAERRDQDRKLGKLYKSILSDKQRRR